MPYQYTCPECSSTIVRAYKPKGQVTCKFKRCKAKFDPPHLTPIQKSPPPQERSDRIPTKPFNSKNFFKAKAKELERIFKKGELKAKAREKEREYQKALKVKAREKEREKGASKSKAREREYEKAATKASAAKDKFAFSSEEEDVTDLDITDRPTIKSFPNVSSYLFSDEDEEMDIPPVRDNYSEIAMVSEDEEDDVRSMNTLSRRLMEAATNFDESEEEYTKTSKSSTKSEKKSKNDVSRSREEKTNLYRRYQDSDDDISQPTRKRPTSYRSDEESEEEFPHTKRTPKKKPTLYRSESEEELPRTKRPLKKKPTSYRSDEESEEELPRTKRPSKKKPTSHRSEEESEEELSRTKRPSKKKSTSRRSEEESEEELPRTKRPSKKKSTSRRSEEESEEELPRYKRPAKKKPTSYSSDEESEEELPKTKRPPKKKPTSHRSQEESEEELLRTKRPPKKVKREDGEVDYNLLRKKTSSKRAYSSSEEEESHHKKKSTRQVRNSQEEEDTRRESIRKGKTRRVIRRDDSDDDDLSPVRKNKLSRKEKSIRDYRRGEDSEDEFQLTEEESSDEEASDDGEMTGNRPASVIKRNGSLTPSSEEEEARGRKPKKQVPKVDSAGGDASKNETKAEQFDVYFKGNPKPKKGNRAGARYHPYIVFNKMERRNFRDLHPELDSNALSAKMGAAWKELSWDEKDKYEEIGKEWSKREAEENKNKRVLPKLPPNGYILFKSKVGPQYRHEFSKEPNAYNKKMTELWRNMPKEEKEEYQREALRQKAKFKEENPEIYAEKLKEMRKRKEAKQKQAIRDQAHLY